MLKKIRRGEVWKYINKKKEKREGIKNDIGEETWREHFMQLLGGEKLGTRRTKVEEEELEV